MVYVSSNMGFMVAENFRQLAVYQRSVDGARRIYKITIGFPAHERYSPSDQIRRSSRAVGALIAEAWARRRYTAAFVDKLSQAQAEATETQVWLDHAHACGLLDEEAFSEMDADWQQIGGMLQVMIDKAPSFQPKIRP